MEYAISLLQEKRAEISCKLVIQKGKQTEFGKYGTSPYDADCYETTIRIHVYKSMIRDLDKAIEILTQQCTST